MGTSASGSLGTSDGEASSDEICRVGAPGSLEPSATEETPAHPPGLRRGGLVGESMARGAQF